VILSSAQRFDDVESLAATIKKRFQNAEFRLVVGPNWTSQRRLRPIPDDLSVTHWYQLNDELRVHWLNQSAAVTASPPSAEAVSESSTAATSAAAVPTLKSDLKPTLRRIVEHVHARKTLGEISTSLVGCLTVGSTAESLWREVFSGLNVPSVQFPNSNEIPSAEFRAFVLDLGSIQLERSQGAVTMDAIYSTIKILQRISPTANVLIVDPFPESDAWRRWSELGAICLPAPFSVTAISHWIANPGSTSAKRHFSSAS
jgi:hypothetical protein